MRAVILVRPENPENTGFIARLCANFDFSMRLVEPEFNLSEARKTASRAQDILREARIFDSVDNAVEDLDYILGTKPGRGTEVGSMNSRSNTSIMVGPESSGLSNDELERCDAVAHIDTSDYSSVNQSHASAILMYELREKNEKGMSSGQKQRIADLLGDGVLKEAVMRANPSEEEADRILGEMDDLRG